MSAGQLSLLPADPRTPTLDEIASARLTRAQLAAWGVPWPPPRGWRKKLERRARAVHEGHLR